MTRPRRDTMIRALSAIVLSQLFITPNLQATMRPIDFFDDPFRQATAFDYSFLGEPVNSIIDQRATLRQSLWHSDTTVWRANARFGDFQDNGTMYPSSLWDVEAGASVDHKLEANRSWGLRASLGSASDIPFNSPHETVVQVSGHYKTPSGANNAWLLMLSFSNNRSFANNVPLPGIAYMIRTDDRKLFAVLGLPFLAVTYNFTDDTSARISYFFPFSVLTEISQRVVGPLKAFIGFDWDQDVWLRANRPDYTQRLYFDGKTAGGGLRAPLTRNLAFELAGGYAFGRRFFEASSVLQSKSTDQDLTPSPYGVARVGLHF